MFSALLLTGSLLMGQGQDEAASAELARQVKSLVAELSVGGLARREAAQQKLLELGPAVLDHLPEPTVRTSAEEKQRLAQIREKLEQRQAGDSVKATRVSLSGELPLSEIFTTIEQQTGNVMTDQRERFGEEAADPKLKVELDNVPFWKAIDQVFDQAGLTVYAYPENDSVAAVSRPEDELPRCERPVSYSGAFRLEAVDLIARRGLRTPAAGQLQLTMEVSWEPRLDPITLQHPLDEIHAFDEEGNPIELTLDEGLRESPILPGELTTEMLLPFALPSRDVKKIAKLRGKFLAMVPGRAEVFRFDDLTQRNVERRKAGVTVVLDQVRKNVDVWEVRVLVRFDKAEGALESHRGWVFNNEAYLETADKKKITFDGFETTRQTEDEVGVAYIIDLPNGPAGLTFVYHTPTVITLLPVEYEVTDLELP